MGLDLYDDAWQELEKVEPTARTVIAVLTLRVDILLAKGQTDHARTIAAGLVRTHPDAAPGYYALGLVEARAGNLPGARDALTAAFNVNPQLKLVAFDDARLDVYWRTLGA